MNSIKFINKEIQRINRIICVTQDDIALYTENKRDTSELKVKLTVLENHLNSLQQVKTELEAWEELNKLFIIKPYYQDRENNKHPAIMIQHEIETDFEYVRRGCKQKSFDTIEKALEIKDEI